MVLDTDAFVILNKNFKMLRYSKKSVTILHERIRNKGMKQKKRTVCIGLDVLYRGFNRIFRWAQGRDCEGETPRGKGAAPLRSEPLSPFRFPLLACSSQANYAQFAPQICAPLSSFPSPYAPSSRHWPSLAVIPHSFRQKSADPLCQRISASCSVFSRFRV